ncbi:hypothetical protein ACROYT_G015114 [Oculina patagonica]
MSWEVKAHFSNELEPPTPILLETNGRPLVKKQFAYNNDDDDDDKHSVSDREVHLQTTSTVQVRLNDYQLFLFFLRFFSDSGQTERVHKLNATRNGVSWVTC